MMLATIHSHTCPHISYLPSPFTIALHLALSPAILLPFFILRPLLPKIHLNPVIHFCCGPPHSHHLNFDFHYSAHHPIFMYPTHMPNYLNAFFSALPTVHLLHSHISLIPSFLILFPLLKTHIALNLFVSKTSNPYFQAHTLLMADI